MGNVIYMDEKRSEAPSGASFFDKNLVFLLAGGAVIIGVFLAYLLSTGKGGERPVIE